MVKFLSYLKSHSKFQNRILPIIAAIFSGLIITVVYLGIKDSNSFDFQTDVLVYGTSLGGLSASITLADNHIQNIIIGENTNLGGQATDSGLSSFDEGGQSWENSGIYADLKHYLIQKYNLSGRNVGLGNAVVGSLATIPSDIQEYFQKALTQRKKDLQLMQNYTLIKVNKTNGIYSDAQLENNLTHKILKIKFKYLIDATPTGKAYEIAGANYNIGFDKKETTNELNALPATVRDYFINGVISSAGKVGGLGNRTQAQSRIFAVYDKGYYGNFYPFQSSTCTVKSSKKAYIKSATVYQAITNNCESTLTVNTSYADSYKLYYINKGSSQINIHLTDQSGLILNIIKSINPTEQFIDLGNYHLDINNSLTINLNSSKANEVEGVIISHNNENISKIKNTDLILDYNSALKSGNWFSTITPIGSTAHSSKGGSQLEWQFSTDTANKFALLLDWFAFNDRSPNVQIIVTDLATNTVLNQNTFTEKIKSRNEAFPILSFQAEAGKKYRIVLKNTANILTITSLVARSLNSNNYLQLESGTSSTFNLTGIYDLWAKPLDINKQPLVNISLSGVKYSPIKLNNNEYHSLGRFFIDSNLLVNSSEKLEILPIEVTNTEIFQSKLTPGKNLNLTELAEGRYKATINCPSSCNLQLGIVDTNGAPLSAVGLYTTNQTTYTSDLIYINNSQATYLKLDGNYNNAKIYLYADIPQDYNTQIFSHDRPLLTPTNPNIIIFKQQTFFNYRNIISSENLLAMPWPKQLNWQNTATNTLGVSIVSTSFDDYGPILVNKIDSTEYGEGAKELAYQYYYWLKYDYPSDNSQLGCLRDQLICNSKRIELSLDIFSSPDGFPSSNYFREGRRLNSIKPLTENDLLAEEVACSNGSCSNCNGISYGDQCLATSQSPTLFQDALFPAYYQIDFHSFQSRQEDQSGNISTFVNYVLNQNLLQPNNSVFNRINLAKPAEITLGSLIPNDFSNIFPGSTNIGETQIASASYRTHPIEIGIGTSTGYVISYLLKNNLTPKML